MGNDEPAARELARLKRHRSPLQRGYEFQRFIGSLFGEKHFSVAESPGAASPRQVDLLVVRGGEAYLVETKWRKTKANIDDVDSLLTRLRATAPGVVGLLVSYAGFTPQVIERVRAESSSPVLLLSGQELDWVVSWDGDLVRLLRRKREQLLVHREVLLDVIESPARGKARESLSTAHHQFLIDGVRSKVLSTRGDFGSFVFVREIPDIDWTHNGGFGVQLDLRLRLADQQQLIAALARLSAMGWTTSKGRWSIQQATTNWHGLGAHELAAALRGWKPRHTHLAAGEIHHSEEVCYFDECDGGFFTLRANVSSDRRRATWQADLSFQLEGVPLEMDAFRELATAFRVDIPAHFRPRSEQSVRREWIPPEQRRPLKVVGLIVGKVEHDVDEWVVGLVARTPLPAKGAPPAWFPPVVRDSELIICDLASWHQLGGRKRTYRLRSVEIAPTSDALAVRFVADWDDTRRRSGVPRIVEWDDGAPVLLEVRNLADVD